MPALPASEPDHRVFLQGAVVQPRSRLVTYPITVVARTDKSRAVCRETQRLFAFGVDRPVDGNISPAGLAVGTATANILPGGQCGSGIPTDFELDLTADMDITIAEGTCNVICSGTMGVAIPVYRPDADVQAVGGTGDLSVSGSGTVTGGGTISEQGSVHMSVTGQMVVNQSMQQELHLDLALSSNVTMIFCGSSGCTPPVPMPGPHCPIPRQLILPVPDGYVEEWTFSPESGQTMHYRVTLNVAPLL